MNKIINLVLTGLLLTPVTVNLAAAQSQCSCSSASSATVTSVLGDVTTSGAFGFGAGEAGQVLSAGSEVYTAVGASSTISFGAGCNLQLNGNQKAVIVNQPSSAAVCAEVSEFVAAETTAASAGFETGWIIPAIAIGGVVALIAIDDDDPTPTPTPTPAPVSQ